VFLKRISFVAGSSVANQGMGPGHELLEAFWVGEHRRAMAIGKNRAGAIHHVIGLAWVVGSAILVLAPAIHRGLFLGPYDILSQSGLTHAAGIIPQNTANGDQIAEMIPWSTLAWTQVHAGHLPLWNPFSGLGLPLAFNWQSAAFSLPVVITYAFPLHLSYAIQLIVTLGVAGSGAYVLARTLHLGVIACATAGTIYELSGSFMGWLGWPHAAVMSWAGWLFALAILIIRGRHRTRNIVLFASMFALAIFSGQPEILTILTVSVVLFAAIMLVVRNRTNHERNASLRPLLDLSVAVLAGAALGSPLALPGLQVLASSTRQSPQLLLNTEVGKSLPPHDLVHLLVQGYNGLPIAGSHVFGDAVYFDTAAYIGVVGIALAVLGAVRGWRRPEVASFAALTVVTGAIVFAPPGEALLRRLPLVQTIDWHRDLMILSLCLAILAAVGMDLLVRGIDNRRTQRTLFYALAGCLGILVLLRLAGSSGLSPVDAALRRKSLTWPMIISALSLALVAIPTYSTKIHSHLERIQDRLQPVRGIHLLSTGRVIGILFLLLETAFLVPLGSQLISSAAHGATPDQAVKTLIRTVGDSVVGFGANTCFQGPAISTLGLLPESNSLFGIHEFDIYDPVLPNAYLQSWAEESPTTAGVPIYNSFCPALTTASQARTYGVAFVLEPDHSSGPTGSIFDRTVGNERLYRIPDSAQATLSPLSGSDFPSLDAASTPVNVEHPSPSSWQIRTTDQSEQVLRLRLTDEPGWHATIDGRPLALESYAKVMMQARIPAGDHVIQIRYWPPLFTLGLVLAGTCAIVLLAAVSVALLKRRRETNAT
jgi:hypothetical protein